MGKILGITFLTASFFYLYNKIKAFIKYKQKQALLKQAEFKKQQEYLNRLKKYNSINNYTICLSLNYRVKRDFSKENKIVINKVVYNKLKDMLSNANLNIEIKTYQDSLIIMSDDFGSYDSVFDILLKALSKIKSEVDDRYEIYMMPSITTDAYEGRPELELIERNHLNIKHCNLINMSCSTNMFLKKYKNLNKNKYIGIPIGEYSILDDKKENVYELNMVYKDLSKKLESLGQ